MRHHIRVFETEQDFARYDSGDDRWKPLVAYITETDRVVFQRLGEKFIEVLNGGTCYVTD